MKKLLSILAITSFWMTGLQVGVSTAQAAQKTSEADLVQNWGPWASLAPAAGGGRGFNPGISLQSRNYDIRPGQISRTDPGVIDGSGPGNFVATHAEGAIVGYGRYIRPFEETGDMAGQYVYQLQGNPEEGYTGTAELKCLTLPGAAAGNMNSISIPSIELDEVNLQSDSLRIAADSEFQAIKPSYDSEGNLLGYGHFDVATNSYYPYIPDALYVSSSSWPYIRWQPADPESPEEFAVFIGLNVVGYVSPIDVINNIALSDLHNITYIGATLNTSQPVELNVDFAAATWTGSFGAQGDGGFVAAGVVTGQDFQSVQSGFSENIVAEISTVNGSFYGSEAQGAGGVLDVTFVESDGGGRVVDSFITVDESLGVALVPEAPVDGPT